MAERKPRTLAAVLQAARALFLSNQVLSVWDAVEKVLDGLTDAELVDMYKQYSYPWCREALARGTFLPSGIVALGAELRRDDNLRRQDDARSGLSASPSQRGRHRRRR